MRNPLESAYHVANEAVKAESILTAAGHITRWYVQFDGRNSFSLKTTCLIICGWMVLFSPLYTSGPGLSFFQALLQADGGVLGIQLKRSVYFNQHRSQWMMCRTRVRLALPLVYLSVIFRYISPLLYSAVRSTTRFVPVDMALKWILRVSDDDATMKAYR